MADPFSLSINQRQADLMARLAYAEAGSLQKYGPKSWQGVVDSITNRAAAQSWYGNGVDGVMNKRSQYTPVSNAGGNAANLPPAPPQFAQQVNDYLAQRAQGAPPATGDTTHFVNPNQATGSQWQKWGTPSALAAATMIGNPRGDVHYYMHPPGEAGPKPYNIALDQMPLRPPANVANAGPTMPPVPFPPPRPPDATGLASLPRLPFPGTPGAQTVQPPPPDVQRAMASLAGPGGNPFDASGFAAMQGGINNKLPPLPPPQFGSLNQPPPPQPFPGSNSRVAQGFGDIGAANPFNTAQGMPPPPPVPPPPMNTPPPMPAMPQMPSPASQVAQGFDSLGPQASMAMSPFKDPVGSGGFGAPPTMSAMNNPFQMGGFGGTSPSPPMRPFSPDMMMGMNQRTSTNNWTGVPQSNPAFVPETPSAGPSIRPPQQFQPNALGGAPSMGGMGGPPPPPKMGNTGALPAGMGPNGYLPNGQVIPNLDERYLNLYGMGMTGWGGFGGGGGGSPFSGL